MNADQIKKIVALAALDLVQPGMKLGIGSGTTVFEFIKALETKIASGLPLEVICASIESENIAKQHGLIINNTLDHCDLYIDGADEIDAQKNCLKGKGRALFREKIIATMSSHVVILIDESKKSQTLQKAPIVCELLPFGISATIRHINQLGFKGHLRKDASHQLVKTDNGNFLFDIELDKPIQDPDHTHKSLKHIPGVLETGLFYNIVSTVIVGYKDGQVLAY